MTKNKEVKMKDRHRTRSIFTTLFMTLIALLVLPGFALAFFTDADITTAVETQIILDPGVKLNTLDVETANGVVTLSGSVDNILAKDRAVRVAQTVKGVRAVVDRISVDPPLRSDSALEKDIGGAFDHDPLSESWEVEATVKNGTVTLSGVVDSWAERDLVGKIAKGVRGVRAVENKIAVSYKAERSDNEIKEEIERRLTWDALVDDSLIDVKVEASEVVMTGAVGSVAERLRAFSDGWVAGVKSVDTSGLEVKWWARNDKLRKDKYVSRSDSEIRDAVQDAFLYDPWVNRSKIVVYVDNGQVTLSGVVDNLKAKRAAARDARNTVGVRKVKNHIRVRPSTPTDEEIAKNIGEVLRMDPYMERQEIYVSVANGEVYLSGTVDSYFEKAHADAITAGIYGVTEVHNLLKVEDNDVLTYNPYIDPWYVYDYDWYVYPDIIPVESDREIKEAINDELFWSPFVDSDDITVTVDDGIATLSGTVESWGEYNAAVENALEGGAVAVDNDLMVSSWR